MIDVDYINIYYTFIGNIGSQRLGKYRQKAIDRNGERGMT